MKEWTAAYEAGRKAERKEVMELLGENKPPVLASQEVQIWCGNKELIRNALCDRQAQRDADVEYYQKKLKEWGIDEDNRY